jgi:hypothetical protein
VQLLWAFMELSFSYTASLLWECCYPLFTSCSVPYIGLCVSVHTVCHTYVGVGVILAADSQSTSASGYQASLWDP